MIAKENEKRRRRKTYSAPALEKGLDILELYATEGEPMATTTVAQKLGRSVGEIFRMLMVLEQRGYITAVGGDKYFLSLKLYTVGARHAPIKRLTMAATDTMRWLAREVEQSCHLVVYNPGRGIVVAQVDSPGDRIHSVRLGAEAPLMNSCSGHILLAYASPQERKAMLAESPPHFKSRVSQSALERITDAVLKRGYESIESEQVAGVRDIGYPIFDESGSAVAALVMPYLQFLDGSHKTPIGTAQKALAKAASTISTAMGYRRDE